MAMYCEVCGEELDPEEESEGICDSCKISRSKQHEHDEETEEYHDPGIA